MYLFPVNGSLSYYHRLFPVKDLFSVFQYFFIRGTVILAPQPCVLASPHPRAGSRMAPSPLVGVTVLYFLGEVGPFIPEAIFFVRTPLFLCQAQGFSCRPSGPPRHFVTISDFAISPPIFYRDPLNGFPARGSTSFSLRCLVLACSFCFLIICFNELILTAPAILRILPFFYDISLTSVLFFQSLSLPFPLSIYPYFFSSFPNLWFFFMAFRRVPSFLF